MLGSITIPAANIPIGNQSNLSFDFSNQTLILVDGVRYAMVLSSPASAEDSFAWYLDGNDPYESGLSWQSLDSGATWQPVEDSDYTFTTTMIAEADPRFEVLVGGDGVPLMFGNIVSSSIHGFKFEDLNGDGIYDNNDPPLPGVWFRLTGTNVQGSFVDLVAATDSDGEFWFTDLLPSVIGEGPTDRLYDYGNPAQWISIIYWADVGPVQFGVGRRTRVARRSSRAWR